MSNEPNPSPQQRGPSRGIGTPEMLEERLGEEWAWAQRRREPCAYLDVRIDSPSVRSSDESKPSGDTDIQREQLERVVAARLYKQLRREDFLARAEGGVAILLRGTALSGALRLAERAQVALREPFDIKGVGTFTVSIGISLTTEVASKSLVEWRSLARTRLLEAQSKGGNRVEPAPTGRPLWHVFGPAAVVTCIVLIFVFARRKVESAAALAPASSTSASVSPSPAVSTNAAVLGTALPSSLPTGSVSSSAVGLAMIAGIDLDRTTACLNGDFQYRVRAVGPAHERFTALTKIGDRQSRGMVGLARPHVSDRAAGGTLLDVTLVDEMSGEVLSHKTVPIRFESCEEPPTMALPIRCDIPPQGVKAYCTTVGLTSLRWSIRAAYPDKDGEPLVKEGGPKVELDVPPHFGSGPDEAYWVSATGSNRSGVAQGGRTQLTRPRPGWRLRMSTGELLVTARELGEDTFELTNHAGEALSLEPSLSVVSLPCERGKSPKTDTLSAVAVMGRTHVDAFERWKVTFRPSLSPGYCAQRVMLRGQGVTSRGQVQGFLHAAGKLPK